MDGFGLNLKHTKGPASFLNWKRWMPPSRHTGCVKSAFIVLLLLLVCVCVCVRVRVHTHTTCGPMHEQVGFFFSFFFESRDLWRHAGVGVRGAPLFRV